MSKIPFQLALLSLSALTFFSCKKDEKTAVTGDVMRFTALVDNGGAKTWIDGFNNIRWTEKDSIFINGKVFHSELEGNGETAVFTGPALEETTYTAYFGVEKDGDAYKLPATQTYNSANNLSGINPMYAESGTTELQFHHICALMKLVVRGEGKVRGISVSADQPLSGAFTIEDGAETGYYASVSSGSNAVTLVCNNIIELESGKDTTFYIALPQGEYTNLRFKLYDDASGVWESAPICRKLNAGKIRTKELTNVSVAVPALLSGVFSVGDNKKVQFSRGNLYCMRSGSAKAYAYSFAFEEKQYDCRSYNGSYEGNGYKDGVSYETPANTSGLFQWNVADAVTGKGFGAFTEESSISYSTSDKMDWGLALGSGWQTLTNDSDEEWNYLFNSRITTDGIRYAKATVNKVPGVILVPDDWNKNTYDLKSTNTVDAFFTANKIDANAWNNTLEPNGCVFLPAAGYRSSTSVNEVGLVGDYWSSSYYDNDLAYSLRFYKGYVFPMRHSSVSNGSSVRLVQEVK